MAVWDRRQPAGPRPPPRTRKAVALQRLAGQRLLQPDEYEELERRIDAARLHGPRPRGGGGAARRRAAAGRAGQLRRAIPRPRPPGCSGCTQPPRACALAAPATSSVAPFPRWPPLPSPPPHLRPRPCRRSRRSERPHEHHHRSPAGFKSRLETALLATLGEQVSQPAQPEPAWQRHRGVVAGAW